MGDYYKSFLSVTGRPLNFAPPGGTLFTKLTISGYTCKDKSLEISVFLSNFAE